MFRAFHGEDRTLLALTDHSLDPGDLGQHRQGRVEPAVAEHGHDVLVPGDGVAKGDASQPVLLLSGLERRHRFGPVETEHVDLLEVEILHRRRHGLI